MKSILQKVLEKISSNFAKGNHLFFTVSPSSFDGNPMLHVTVDCEHLTAGHLFSYVLEYASKNKLSTDDLKSLSEAFFSMTTQRIGSDTLYHFVEVEWSEEK